MASFLFGESVGSNLLSNALGSPLARFIDNAKTKLVIVAANVVEKVNEAVDNCRFAEQKSGSWVFFRLFPPDIYASNLQVSVVPSGDVLRCQYH